MYTSNVFSGIGKYLILSAILWMTAVGCCNKKDCATGGLQLKFRNYDITELDSVVAFTYPKNAVFALPIDSQRLYTIVDSIQGYGVAQLPFKGFSYDYQIRVPSIGQVHTITDLETEKKGCNSCFPHWPESDYYDVLSAYKVDGQRREGGTIEIYK